MPSALGLVDYGYYERKWNWPNIVLKYLLSETIHAQQNGRRGTHFAKFLNSKFLKGLTYSAMSSRTKYRLMRITDSTLWNDRSNQSMSSQISEQSEFCFDADLGLAPGWCAIEQMCWKLEPTVWRIGSQQWRISRIFPNVAFVRTASWDLDQIFNHKSSNGWNAFVANIVVFSNYLYVAANLDS